MHNDKLARLCRYLDDASITVMRDVSLIKYSHMRCGGSVDILAMPHNLQQLILCVQYVIELAVPYYILGNGSKVLVLDGRYNGVVICTRHVQGITIDSVNNSAFVLCGTHTMLCARALADSGLSGAEYMYCLPATVGGAVYMNAGCYNQCTADIVYSVYCIHMVTGQIVTLSGSQCQWGRRSSIFQNQCLLVLGVNLLLTRCDKQCIINSMKAHMASKLLAQPLTLPSLGSSYYTTSGTSASALIDMAGLKGYTIGGAQVSTKHAGFVVNTNNANSHHVVQLLDYIAHTIQHEYGVSMHREIVFMTMRGNYDTGRLSYTHEI